MSDGLGLFDDEDVSQASRRFHDDSTTRRRRRGVVTWTVVVVVLAVVGVVVWFGLREIAGIGGYADYSGDGQTDVLFQVQSGQAIRDIAANLQKSGVVASAKAFTVAGEDEEDLQSVRPGYYVMRTKMSGRTAVARMLAPSSKVGELQIRPGSRMDDITQPNGATTPGILSRLAKASCAELNGMSTCVSVDTLRSAARTADLTSLGVPRWAIPDVQKADPAHRLEGLIAPDVYQVKPGDNAEKLLNTVITASAIRLQADGMPDLAKNTGFTPYQLLTIASLAESEAITSDFGKVARVTYNRLAANQKLEYDSTINYVLDRPEIRTQESDRANPGPYNTYLQNGLPPTPIASASVDALNAAANPIPGNWLYFVKCKSTGQSCFAATEQEHQQNVQQAQAEHVY